MKQQNTTELVKVFLLGVIATLLAVAVFRPNTTNVTYAADGGAMGAASGNIIALTGAEKSTLYLVDTENQQIAQYAVDNARFSLRSARHYSQDLKIYEEDRKGGIKISDAVRASKKKRPKSD